MRWIGNNQNIVIATLWQIMSSYEGCLCLIFEEIKTVLFMDFRKLHIRSFEINGFKDFKLS